MAIYALECWDEKDNILNRSIFRNLKDAKWFKMYYETNPFYKYVKLVTIRKLKGLEYIECDKFMGSSNHMVWEV